jgi:hypothetical protein
LLTELNPSRLFSIVQVAAILGCTMSPAIADSTFSDVTYSFDKLVYDFSSRPLIPTTSYGLGINYPIVLERRSENPSTLVFFSTGDKCHSSEVRPIIASFWDGIWKTATFGDQAFQSHYWDRVFRPIGDNSTIFAISRASCGDRGSELFVYRSFDDGATWRVSSISIYYMATFVSMRIDAAGVGEIVAHVDADIRPPAGNYIFHTDDWGATWSSPEFRASALGPVIKRRDQVGNVGSAPDVIQRISADYEQRNNKE